MEVRKLHFMSCHLAGRMYHDADEVWDKLEVGTLLRLERDLDNRYDPEAVAVMFDDEEENETYRLGYIPRDDNTEIAALLEMGWTEIFECRICKLNGDAHPEQQIHLTIKIKKKSC